MVQTFEKSLYEMESHNNAVVLILTDNTLEEKGLNGLPIVSEPQISTFVKTSFITIVIRIIDISLGRIK